MEKTEKLSRVNDTYYAKSHNWQIARDAMFVALTLVFTAFVNIQIPSFGGAGGLVHLGNVPLLIGAMIYGKRTGAIAGALGMGLFDILSGWAVWAPCTIITCGMMGFVVGSICEKRRGMIYRVWAIIAALGIKICGYYIYESAVLGNGLVAALKSIPGNVIQVGVASVIVLMIIKPLEKRLKYIGYR